MHAELVIIMTIVWGFMLFIISTIVLLKLRTVETTGGLRRSLHQLFYLYDIFGLFITKMDRCHTDFVPGRSGPV
jgi:hypothetical protein